MGLIENVIHGLEECRERILSGGINSIPSPFERFSNDFLGIEKAKMYLVSANLKVGKSQLTNFIFVSNTILYTYYNPSKAKVKIYYFNLEEPKETITLRFICYLLYVFSSGEIRLNVNDLQSSKNKALDPRILEILREEPYKSILEHFENCVDFRTERHPTGISIALKNYIKEHGETFYKDLEITLKTGEKKVMAVYNGYKPYDPDEYFIGIIDHISLITPESGLSLKLSIDLLSSNLVKLRNNYFMIPVIVQQQAADQESTENFKLSKLRPSPNGLADSKYPGRDCDIMLGIFSPARHEIREYMGYDITLFKNNIRFLEVCVNRGGEANSLCPLYFDGCVNYFSELPLPTDQVGLTKFYDLLKINKNHIVNLLYKHKKNLWEKLSEFLGNLGKVKQPH